MAKRNFLKPVAVLAATLASSAYANLPDTAEQSLKAAAAHAAKAQSVLAYTNKSDTSFLYQDFIIAPSVISVQMAAHSSHASHASHSSHSSHASSSY